MSQAPSMPVFTDALIGDTTDLSMEEFGAYLMILFVTWRNNGKPLPDDDMRMARICRMSESEWSAIKPTISRYFDITEGFWRQKRLEKEWDFVQKRIEVKKANGKKGGRPKSLKDNETDKPVGFVEDNLNHKLNESTHTHTHTQQKSSDANASQTREGRDAKEEALRGLNEDFAAWWKLYPNKVGRPVAMKAFAKARKAADQSTLLNATERYVERLARPNAPNPCNPATWLNQERWNDQPMQQTEKASNVQQLNFTRTYQTDFGSTVRAISKAIPGFDDALDELDGGRACAH